MTEANNKKRQSFDNRSRHSTAIATKLMKNPTGQRAYDDKGNRKQTPPPTSVLNAMSQRTAQVGQDIESMKQLLPDITLSEQILVSSILSPKDMTTPTLSFANGANFENQELGPKLAKILSDYFTNDYKINTKLSGILKDALFGSGAHIRMIIPESSLDDIINESGRITLESVRPHIRSTSSLALESIGILGPSDDSLKDKNKADENAEVSFESMFVDRPSNPREEDKIEKSCFITVTDNPDAVKMPLLFDKIRQDKVRSALTRRFRGASLEARKEKEEKKGKKDKDKSKVEKEQEQKEKRVSLGKTDREIEERLAANRDLTAEPLVEVKTHEQTGRDMYGHPLVTTLATEAVIPAHTPGNPSDHIGYFVLLDQYGNPVNMSSVQDHYQDLRSQFSKNTADNQVSSLLKEIRGMQGMDFQQDPTQAIQQATDAFADIIERNLLSRLRNGVGHSAAELGRPSDIYQIMMSRAMRKKRTQLLYVPTELMSYVAFDFTHTGIGKSLLEESRIVGSLRAILMFANTIAAIKNSSSRTDLEITLDPEDTDPMSTITQVKDAFMRSRSEAFPLGEGNPGAIVDYLNKSGVDVLYSGHPGLPEMRVQANDKQGGRTIVDRDLEDQLRRQHIMGFGLSPETVDVSGDIEFATSLVNSSLLLNKRVALYQQQFERMEGDFICKYTRNSEPLITKLEECITEYGHKKDKEDPEKVIEKFLSNLEVQLPKPDSVTLETQMEAFRNYQDALDMAVGAFINDEMEMLDAEGDFGRNLRNIKATIKAYYERRWLRDNNVLPELFEMVDKGLDDKPMLEFGEIHSAHMESILGAFREYVKQAEEARKKREAKAAEEGEEVPGDSTGDDASSSSGGFGSDDNSDSGGFGDDSTNTDDNNSDDGLGGGLGDDWL
tara:strand:- start:59909 stop:62599 length:2691 start_codon:yes stop_codon:yes gene_type:complete